MSFWVVEHEEGNGIGWVLGGGGRFWGTTRPVTGLIKGR